MTSPLITLLTDFGTGSGYPAQMKGVIATLAPGARVVDVSHEIPPFQVLIGQLMLRDVAAHWPKGTIHVAVVDPGVGSTRRPLLVVGGEKAEGQFFIGPDNGLLWPFMRGGRVYELAAPEFRRSAVAATFHGRDIFAPAAAHLANGVDPERFGPEIADPVKLVVPRVRREGGAVVGEILYVDHFGNLVSNLDIEDLPQVPPSELRISFAGRTVTGLVNTYSDVAPGAFVALIGSSGRLEIGVREGSAERVLGGGDGRGMPVVVEAASG